MIEPVKYLESVTSTNQYLIDLAPALLPGDIKAVATFNQTNGRGQRGNTWLSEPGCNISYSLIFRPAGLLAIEQFLISEAVTLTVQSFLSDYANGITIKWPNDIYWRDNKLTGILIEDHVANGAITQSIVGIGININQHTFSADIPFATSLSNITGMNYDLTELTDKLHHRLCKSLSELTSDKAEELRRFYINNLYRRDGFHAYTDKNGTFQARICGISMLGQLLLELEDHSVRTYNFKEVQFNL
ncbi:MAG: biotin--[acetyl-CoA-carboxylase] ligase [Bacteroidota bacterium]|nr:biotin--[acetyl-CoA-carboxylase] ligase [Bacteroidota bacterium]